MDFAKLRELALAATPGPWGAYCRDVGWREGVPWTADRFLQWELDGPPEPNGRGQFYEPDARYIAAVDPQTVTALLDALDALADCDDEDEARSQATEPDVYTSDLMAWLASHGSRPGYVDEAAEEYGFGPEVSITDRVGWGQMHEAGEVFDAVVSGVRDAISDRLGADPDEEGEDLTDDDIRAALEIKGATCAD